MPTVASSTQARTQRKAISLFSSAGIGELGLKASGVEILASNELLEDRQALYQHNFPGTNCFLGDIWARKDDILKFTIDACGNDDLFMVYATPPCQGMSSNGLGRLQHEVRQGNRSPIDERNRLIVPTMQIISKLRPSWVLLENVPGMRRTIIEDEDGTRVNIMNHIEQMLGHEYVGTGEIICCSEYGVPQLRKRLITIYTKDPAGIEYFNRNGKSFFAANDRRPAITLRQAIGHLPPLDAKNGFESTTGFCGLHRVPILGKDKYWWVDNTAEGDTAYNNQCCNPRCKSRGNPLHLDVFVNDRWQSNKDTPVYCVDCGELLPRPSMIDKATAKRRLIKGFHSAYRRMVWDEPSRALTKNYIYEASDNKIHPSQNRVLSMFEALIIQTIDRYEYSFVLNGKPVSTKLFAEIVGESVPPALIEMLCTKFTRLSDGDITDVADVSAVQVPLFS